MVRQKRREFFNDSRSIPPFSKQVDMKTGDIITCTLCIEVKIESPDRAAVVFDVAPWGTLAGVAMSLQGKLLLDGLFCRSRQAVADLVFFTPHGTLANEQALLSSDVTLTACTNEDGLPPTTTVPPGSHSSSWLRNMGSKVFPPEIAIQTWINEVTKAEARLAGRIIRQWPESLEDDADSDLRMRTRDIEQDPFAQRYGLDQEIEISPHSKINTWKPLTPGCQKYPEGHLGTVAVWDILRVPIGDTLSPVEIIEQWKEDRKKPLWRKAARKAGATEIEFVNEVDDEEVPPNIGRLFVYLERNYRFEVGVNPEIAPFTGQAEVAVLSALAIINQALASEINRNIVGFWNFSTSESTQKLWSATLKIAIQIFKTGRRGWGARVAADIKQGAMVGIYTGPRQEAEIFSSFRASYCFDLDALEDSIKTPKNSYNVDAFARANLIFAAAATVASPT
ncbi:hypothetical protein DFH09DRAFT_1085123 [Mycena vulgaris]|nr:hypothetical protein DFH09DRAFT_1085123 [Mycena vulgaris]